MKKFMKCLLIICIIALLPALSVSASEQTTYSEGFFLYHIGDGYVSLCGYFGSEETVSVPAFLGGQPVSRIESGAFDGCGTVTTVILPDTVMEVQEGAFQGANITDVVGYPQSDPAENETAESTADPSGPEKNPGPDTSAPQPTKPSATTPTQPQASATTPTQAQPSAATPTQTQQSTASTPTNAPPQPTEEAALAGQGEFSEDDSVDAAEENTRNLEAINQLLENGNSEKSAEEAKAENIPSAESTPGTEDLSQEKADTFPLFWVLSAVALLAAITFAFYYKKKTGSPQKSAESEGK